jgi:hypothetical protein
MRHRNVFILILVTAATAAPALAGGLAWSPVAAPVAAVDRAPTEASSWMHYHATTHQDAFDAPTPTAGEPASQPPRFMALRPTPGSLALALGTLASIGLIQAGRSIYRVQLVGFVPEWYHTGGPTQIGYATPIDLELTALIADPLAVPGLGAEAVSRYSPPDDDLAPQRRWVAPWWARGPPPLSC